MEYIMTFHTHFDALQYDRFLKKSGIKGRLQPVPRKLSSSCGTCVRFMTDKNAGEEHVFTDHEFEKLFRLDGNGYVLIVDKDEE